MWWLLPASIVVSCLVHWRIRRFWIAMPLAAVLSPVLLLLASALLTGTQEAFALAVVIFGQVVALPVSVIVGAIFRANRGWWRPRNPFKPHPIRDAN